MQPAKITWIPSYAELKSALEIYGFLFNFLPNTEAAHTGKFLQIYLFMYFFLYGTNCIYDSESIPLWSNCPLLSSFIFFLDSGREGPAQNIRAWIKFVTVSCHVR